VTVMPATARTGDNGKYLEAIGTVTSLRRHDDEAKPCMQEVESLLLSRFQENGVVAKDVVGKK
jgi:hypothetical protein